MENAILETRHIVKQFPKVRANDDVSITLNRGEILCLLGENGAGKSTLMNILYGLYRPTSGQILLDGEPVEFSSPRDAIGHGLGMVHQHFMLVDTLTVTENIILGSEPGKGPVIDYRAAREQVRALSTRYGLKVDPDERVDALSVGLQQRVEILKALYRKARILILDEPTAVLTPQEVEELFGVIRSLRDGGVSIVIITHKLEEVKAISDRVYILRRGVIEGERATETCTKEELANLMVGRNVVLTVQKGAHAPLETPVFELDSVSIADDRGIEAVSGVSLAVKPGEVVGIAGVDGNGQAQLAEAIIGLRPVTAGQVRLAGEPIHDLTVRQRLRQQLGYVPADRQRQGLVLPFTVAENAMIGEHDREPFAHGWWLDYDTINGTARELIDRFDIRTPSPTVPAGNLSGGNQQKVILAREFSRDPKFLLINQPTRGLDVGAIEYVHEEVLRMRGENVGVLLVSLELEEIFALSDRILVMYEGQILREFVPSETDEREVGFYMTGGTERSA